MPHKTNYAKQVNAYKLLIMHTRQIRDSLHGRPAVWWVAVWSDIVSVWSVDVFMQAFTIFCGLGINNCLLYDEKARAAAQQAVALEVWRHFRLVYDTSRPTNGTVLRSWYATLTKCIYRQYLRTVSKCCEECFKILHLISFFYIETNTIVDNLPS